VLSAPRIDAGLALLRVLTGVILAAHGGQKLFVFGFAGVTGAFSQMGIPLPGIAGPLVALVEFFGGLALIVGLLTRLAGLGLAVTMLGAILLVHLSGGFFMPTGYEFALALFASAATLALTGAGAYSLDRLLAGRRALGTRTA
jgi:putative oxidoreductase